jgi:hypothetical protein
MKKQNVNQLVFAKTSLAELNEYQMYEVNGGTNPSAITTSQNISTATCDVTKHMTK